jgi:hypothetical protein
MIAERREIYLRASLGQTQCGGARRLRAARGGIAAAALKKPF